MRDILFRGKRIDNGEWVEGYLVASRENTYPNGFEIITADGINYDELDNFEPNFISDGVISETIGQWTGLVDKNAVKIFEGDIIECYSEGVKARGTVTQRIDGLWIIYPAWQKSKMWGLFPNRYGVADVRVIGNIHDEKEKTP